MNTLKQHFSLVLALVLAVSASVGLYRFLENRESVAHAEPAALLVPVVVAKHDLSMGTRLTEENLALRPWPKDIVTARNYVDTRDLVGRMLRANVIADEPVTPSKLLQAGENISSLIPPNMRAVTITVRRSEMLARMLEKGSLVDVIVIGSNERMDTRVAASNCRVLAADAGAAIKGEKLPSSMDVIVLMSPREAENTIHAQNTAAVDLVLKSGDQPTMKVS